MKKRNRLISLLLAGTLLLSAAGCAGGEGSGSAAAVNTAGAGIANAESMSVLQDGKIEGEITISSFSPMMYQNFIQDAAAKFEALHPGSKINFESFAAMPEVKTAESDGMAIAMIQVGGEDEEAQKPDYINKISTELMSGGGPDIIAADVIPYYNYAASGYLENLSNYMSSDPNFNMNNYRTNIFDGVKINGAQYIMPIDYTFDLVCYDPSLFTEAQLESLKGKTSLTYDEMAEIASDNFVKEDGGATVFNATGGGETRGSMFSSLLDVNYNQFVDIAGKNASFNTGEFETLLETVKEYEEKGYIKQSAETFTDMKNIGGMLSQSDAQPNYFKTTGIAAVLNYLNNLHNPGPMRNMMVMNGAMLTSDDVIQGLLTGSGGELSYDYSQAYAINSNSKNKTLAWEFIKFLIGEDMQLSTAFMGLPVYNDAVLTKAIQQIASGGGAAGMARAVPGQQAGQPNAPQGGGQPVIKQEGGQPNANAQPGGQPNMQQAGQPNMQQGGGKVKMGPGAEPIDIENIELTEAQIKVRDEYMSLVNKYASMLNNHTIIDSTIQSIINTEVKQFFSGAKSAKEVADILQSRVELYLNE